MSRMKFSDLRKEVERRPGGRERLAAARAETLEEIRRQIGLRYPFE